MVEADAADSRAGGVLSQRSPSDHKLHPCAFFSRRLSPAEQNYDVGNRELLAVKLVLEEWRHWLEGAEHPFIVWTDHRNLAYIQSVKRLNSRQARWALYFGCFNFSLTYRPGSLNVKPDALSRLYSPEDPSTDPEPILPPTCLIGARILSLGRWSPLYVWHRGWSRTPVPVLQTACSSWTLQDPGYWSGPIPPGLPATPASPAPWISSAGVSGGPLWTRTSVHL